MDILPDQWPSFLKFPLPPVVDLYAFLQTQRRVGLTGLEAVKLRFFEEAKASVRQQLRAEIQARFPDLLPRLEAAAALIRTATSKLESTTPEPILPAGAYRTSEIQLFYRYLTFCGEKRLSPNTMSFLLGWRGKHAVGFGDGIRRRMMQAHPCPICGDAGSISTTVTLAPVRAPGPYIRCTATGVDFICPHCAHVFSGPIEGEAGWVWPSACRCQACVTSEEMVRGKIIDCATRLRTLKIELPANVPPAGAWLDDAEKVRMTVKLAQQGRPPVLRQVLQNDLHSLDDLRRWLEAATRYRQSARLSVDALLRVARETGVIVHRRVPDEVLVTRVEREVCRLADRLDVVSKSVAPRAFPDGFVGCVTGGRMDSRIELEPGLYTHFASLVSVELPIEEAFEASLNPDHTLRPTKMEFVQLPSHSAKKLCSNEQEQRFLETLRREYPDYHIQVDRPLWLILDLSSMASEFSAADIAYLRNCRIDFSVYDEHGILRRVFELQLGAHHDAPEWIHKDGVKFRACALAGIELEEAF